MSIKPGDKFIIKIGSVFEDNQGRVVYRAYGSQTMTLCEEYIRRYCVQANCAYTEAEKKEMLKEEYNKGYSKGHETGQMIGISEGMDKLRAALCDKDFLKANYGTKNWLHIIRDFEPEQIVSEWKAYHDEKTKRYEQGENFRVGDRVRFVGGTMQGIITGVRENVLNVCQMNGRTIKTTVDMVEKTGGNALDDLKPHTCENCKWWYRWGDLKAGKHTCKHHDSASYDNRTVKDNACDCWEVYS